MKNIPIYQPGVIVENGIKLSSNEAPLGTSSKVIETIHTIVKNIHYYPRHDHKNLHTIIAKKHAVSSENILCGNGSDELISFITQHYLDIQDKVIVGSPSFPMYTIASTLEKAHIVPIPLKNWHFDLERILDTIDNTKMLFLCSPNNPTGTCIDTKELLTFLQAVPETVYVVLDLAYIDFTENKYSLDYNILLSTYKNIILLHTLSKAYGLAGLRVGYAIANTHIISALTSYRMPFNINSIALAAAKEVLNDTVYYNNTLQHVKTEKKRLFEAYETLGCKPIPSQANFITLFPSIDSHIKKKYKQYDTTAKIIFQYFLQQSPPISIRPLDSFGLDSAIRISIGTEQENNLVLDRLSHICIK